MENSEFECTAAEFRLLIKTEIEQLDHVYKTLESSAADRSAYMSDYGQQFHQRLLSALAEFRDAVVEIPEVVQAREEEVDNVLTPEVLMQLNPQAGHSAHDIENEIKEIADKFAIQIESLERFFQERYFALIEMLQTAYADYKSHLDAGEVKEREKKVDVLYLGNVIALTQAMSAQFDRIAHLSGNTLFQAPFLDYTMRRTQELRHRMFF
ncbi:hypothetical protein AB0N09_35495 [Streptomyces erythrochromogenes]|uniref:hypothetical protein n=1 Tax=Streptomyces erythrochromogenes TaxID=285574 RepID=UPI0034403B1C